MNEKRDSLAHDATAGRPARPIGAIRQSYALVVGDSRLRWIALIGLALVVSGLEAIGAALVFVLVGLIADPAGPVYLPIFGDVGRWFPGLDTNALLMLAAAGVGGFFLVRGALVVLQAYVQHRVVYNAGARLSVRLVRGYLAMPYTYHLQHDSAGLVRNALTSVQHTVTNVLLPAAKFVAEILVVAGMAIVLFAIAPIASILMISVVGPATYLVLRLVKARVKRYGRVVTDAAHDSLSTLQQSLHGIRDLRLLDRAEYFVREFRQQRRRDAAARSRQATYAQLTAILVETLLVLSVVVFLVVTVATVGTAAEGFTVIGLFAYVGMRLKPSIQKLISATNNLRFAAPAIDDLHRDLAATAEVVRSSRSQSEAHDTVPTLRRVVRLEGVSFTYPGASRPALNTITLEIRAGEAIGICGPTGGGKTTLVDIVAGLIEPTSGRVLVDGVDIQGDVRSWYSQIGVVSQHMYLFNDTLRRNVALGVLDEEIDDAAVRTAVDMAQLRDFVATLPAGLNTHIGEHGTRMSGGQRQRLAIARALYNDPELLIFDEGTSALDNETERELLAALDRLRGHKTIVLVAHRLTSIRQCDRIIFVGEGGVSGVGTFDELREENSGFRELAV